VIFDSVVVGGGVSGVTAALILAKQGRKVALVEKAPRLAPLIRGFTRGGIDFDSAFHYAGGLGDGEVLDLFMRYLGLAESLEKVPYDNEGFDLFRDVDSGREFRFPWGEGRLRDALCAAFPDEKPAIVNYLNMLDQACRSLPYLTPETPAEAWDSSAVIRGPSLTEVLDGFTGNPELKKLLSLHTLLHGASPSEVPFAIHASVAAPYYRSAYGIVGGGRSLAAAFEAELLECHDCLVSTHPAHFLDIVPDGVLRPAFRKRVRALEETGSAFILYAEASQPVPVLHGTNLILGRSHAAAGEDGDDWPLFIAANSSCAGPTAPRGWVAICPAQWQDTAPWSDLDPARRKAGYRVAKERTAAKLMERIRRQAPEVADEARILEIATPLTLRNFGGSPTGALYGVKHKVGQYNPQPAVRIPGVYLTGQATAGPGVLGAMISAFLTCGHLFGHDHLRKEVLSCR
jgi:all-trans-retinol 13,14-reductase